MRRTTSNRTGKSVSVMTATCGQGTVTQGAVPQAPHARPTLPQLPNPFLVPPAASEGKTWRWGLSPGGRCPAHSQQTAPPTPSRRPCPLPAQPCPPQQTARPLPAHSPPEPTALSAPTWAHFSCHGRHRAARTGLGPQGEGDPRTSQPQKVSDGVSKATGLVQRTQGRLSQACGERRPCRRGGQPQVCGGWLGWTHRVSGGRVDGQLCGRSSTKDALVPHGGGRGMLRISEFCDELEIGGGAD